MRIGVPAPSPRSVARLGLASLLLAAGCAGPAGPPPVAPRLEASPQPAGRVIAVDAVASPGPGFVVIHATDAEGKPLLPASIGATPVPAGPSRHVAVTLSDPVRPGDRLVVMLHADSGQPGVYEFGPASIAEDKPVMDQGRPVAVTITVE
jgi:hypothetical protein